MSKFCDKSLTRHRRKGAAGAALAAPIFCLVAVLGQQFFFDTAVVCFITQT